MRAKRMVNKPHVNADRSPAELRLLLKLREEEIARLKADLAAAAASVVPAAIAGTEAPELQERIAQLSGQVDAERSEQVSAQA